MLSRKCRISSERQDLSLGLPFCDLWPAFVFILEGGWFIAPRGVAATKAVAWPSRSKSSGQVLAMLEHGQEKL